MPDWNPNDIRNQFKRAQDNDWLDAFSQAAAKYGFTTDVLLAIASRETNMRSILGDGGHGHGIMQIDDRSFPEWCQSGAWQNVPECIDKGASVLAAKRQAIQNGQGQQITVSHTTFTGKDNLTDDELLRTSIAAYNAGMWAYWGLSTSGNPDERTTQGDYSEDTLDRAEVFRNLIS
jgi:hypothetical protein